VEVEWPALRRLGDQLDGVVERRHEASGSLRVALGIPVSRLARFGFSLGM
jgi:hypothetical protein